MASGYGSHGASKSKNAFRGWLVDPGSAEDDVDLHASTLRVRARDLDAGGGLARAANRTMKTNVVGGGIIPKPKIDFETLGMSEEAATQWQKTAAKEFSLWADSKNCDAARKMTFYQLEQLAFLSMMMSGDVVALLPLKETPNFPYATRIRLLEADRLATPESSGESTAESIANGRIIDGVEVDADGEVVAYHIATRHPNAQSDDRELTYTRVEAYGRDTGTPNVLHVMTAERPEQMRGIPFVASMIEQIKQLDRYVASELSANLIASMMTVFFTTDLPTEGLSLQSNVAEEDQETDDDVSIELAPGGVYQLKPGVKPQMINPMRSNTCYKDYVESLMTQIAASMEIPIEVLLKKFGSNYTASRGALMEFWRVIRAERKNFVMNFCQPCYEAWLWEAVALGRIEAKGFFDDPLIRKAYCHAEWIGSNMGVIDPKKEMEASMRKISLGISTVEREAAETNGSDWEENILQLRKEKELMAALGLSMQEDSKPAINEPENGKEETVDDEDGDPQDE